MIDTGHVAAPPNNAEKTFDTAPLQTHPLTLSSETSRKMQIELADVGHIATIGLLAGSVAAEVTQSIAPIVTNAQAARRFLDHQPPALDEIRQTLDCIVRDANRASDVTYQIREFFKILSNMPTSTTD